jgi:hypothetical protein
VREMGVSDLLVPVSFFFMGLSSNLLAWSLLLKCTPCESCSEFVRGSRHQRLAYRLLPLFPPLAWWRN